MHKFLMVDDEELIRTGFRQKIDWQALGFEFLDPCANGLQALEAVERLSPDVVMTDVCMPQMDGLQLCRILARDYPHIRVVVLSGHDDFEYARESLRNRVVDYLLKPVTSDELTRFLERLRGDWDRPRLPTEAEVLQAVLEGAASPGPLVWEGGSAEAGTTWCTGRLALFRQPGDPAPAHRLGRVEAVLASRPRPWSGLAAATLKHGGALIEVDLAFSGSDVEHALLRGTRDATRLLSELRNLGFRGVGALGRTKAEAADALVLRFSRPAMFQSAVAAWPAALTTHRPLAGEPSRLQTLLAEGDRPRLMPWLEELGLALQRDPGPLAWARHDLGQLLGTDGPARLETCADGPELVAALEERIHSELSEVANRGASLADRALVRFREQIVARLGEPDLSIDEVSRHLQVSPSYLAKLLRRKWETNFSRYLREARISKAKQLLAATNLTTMLIAEQTGFHDYRYFSTQFKRQEGLTPSGYRGQVRAAS